MTTGSNLLTSETKWDKKKWYRWHNICWSSEILVSKVIGYLSDSTVTIIAVMTCMLSVQARASSVSQYSHRGCPRRGHNVTTIRIIDTDPGTMRVTWSTVNDSQQWSRTASTAILASDMHTPWARCDAGQCMVMAHARGWSSVMVITWRPLVAWTGTCATASAAPPPSYWRKCLLLPPPAGAVGTDVTLLTNIGNCNHDNKDKPPFSQGSFGFWDQS